MRKHSILYLDRHKDKALNRALARYGDVQYASDINLALFAMAETDFDYYFIDADVSQALAFLKHLRHDPQLMQPSGVILLTGNREEDCEAWSVDTFLNRSSAPDELAYVFSHLRAEAPEPANVLRLATFDPPSERNAAVTSLEHEPADNAEEVDPREFFRRSAGGRGPREKAGRARPAVEEPRGDLDRAEGTAETREKPPVAEEKVRARKTSARERKDGARIFNTKARGPEDLRPEDTEPVSSTSKPVATRVALVAVLVLAVAVWAFGWGPFKKQAPEQAKETGRKNVRAESKEEGSAKVSVPTGYSAQTAPFTLTTEAPPSGEQVGNPDPQAPSAAAEQPTNAEASSPPAEPIPAPAPTNSPPSVSISGPTQVVHGQTATFSASASDPDGDSVSLSWTSKSMCWSAPGQYSLSVSATDSKGASSSDAISVRVI